MRARVEKGGLNPPTPGIMWEMGYSSPSDAIEEHDYEEVPVSDEPPPPLPPMRRRTRNHMRRREVRSVSSSFGDVTAAVDADVDVDLLKPVVCCIHKSAGCSWADNLCKLKAHLNMCKYDAVPCRLRCGARIARSLLQEHIQTTCRNRHRQSMFANLHTYLGSGSEDNLLATSSSTATSSSGDAPPLPPALHCKKCRLAFHTHRALKNHLMHGGCGLEMILCDSGCGEKIPRAMMNTHKVSSCAKKSACTNCSLVNEPNVCKKPLTTVAKVLTNQKPQSLCPFRNIGCAFKGERTDVDEHMKAKTSEHLAGLCALVVSQQDEIENLRAALQHLSTNKSGTLMWKVKDVGSQLRTSRASEAVELTSAPFYTSEYGYKLQASVFLNGNGLGDGSHVSVYVKLVPGEFDALLTWPFPHTVSFTLYDQNPDPSRAVNVVESFAPDPSWDNFKRPSSVSSPDALGFGFPMFVPHTVLLHPSRFYLRDDALFLRVKVSK
ncbi:unnamed protein product [Notodromas monacha]|uniref:TNF receptor-associated factor 4 n=1 Tax=Notodromas monacha TaxID=399045 RepID=A0A7R9GC48_9CRUS|nr:unnamed protein product [Notodromas monacha]CAG0915476.1 unnamed protein product [Notodromas monacha]